MPVHLAGMHSASAQNLECGNTTLVPEAGPQHRRGRNGRYRPDMVTGAAGRAAIVALARLPEIPAAPLLHRLLHVPAFDDHHRVAGGLSGLLFDLSVDAE